MARGKEEHQARTALLQSFGKDLARRSKSRCELCEAAGEKLSIVEVPPEPRDPEIGECVMLCEACATAVREPRRFRAGNHWRCLAQTLWSEVPAVQVLALRLLRRQERSEAWARESLEMFYPDDEIEARAAEAD